jgi:hypothetical protein
MEITVIPVTGGGQPGLSIRIDGKEIRFINASERNSLETLAAHIKKAMITAYTVGRNSRTA